MTPPQRRPAAPEHPSNGSGWDSYWQRTGEAAAHRGGGPQDEVLARFWGRLFEDALARRDAPRVLDLACGNGAVARHALEAAERLSQPPPLICGLDRSQPALTRWRGRYALPHGLVGDARRAPFPDGTFDVVASQFGVEYAGPDAIVEAGRLTTADGALAAVLHLKDGGIYQECEASLAAVKGVRASRLLARAADVFRAADSVRRGAGKARFKRADKELAPAVKAVESILETHGRSVAGGAVFRLYNDIAQMYQQPAGYDAAAIVEWTRRMSSELSDYGRRMSAMLDAAFDEPRLGALVSRLAAMGLTVRVRERLLTGPNGNPAAWALVCDRRPAR